MTFLCHLKVLMPLGCLLQHGTMLDITCKELIRLVTYELRSVLIRLNNRNALECEPFIYLGGRGGGGGFEYLARVICILVPDHSQLTLEGVRG